MRDRFLRTALGAAVVLSLAACSEQVTGSLGCPQLCTDQSALLRDTVLTAAIDLDTTFTGFPRVGLTTHPTLVGQGDTADVRLVARYDTLVNTFRPAGATADSAITRVDSAAFVFVIDTTFGRPSGSVRLEAFDVDTTAADTLPATLLPLFRADRALGAQTYLASDIKDTVRLPISNAAVLAKITNGTRLRVGVRLVNVSSTSATARLRIAGGTSPFVRYRVSADSAVAPQVATLLSRTPADESSIARGLSLYSVVASPTLGAPPSSLLAVGGLGGARAFLRFSIPPIVLDSVQVIRATLQLVQRPSRAPGIASDTVRLAPHPVIASPSLTDLFTASQFLGSPIALGLDTLRLVPRDSGVKELELVDLIRTWRSVGTTNTSRSIVLIGDQEGQSAAEIDFYSSDALPASLRPRLRITYVPRRGFGLP